MRLVKEVTGEREVLLCAQTEQISHPLPMGMSSPTFSEVKTVPSEVVFVSFVLGTRTHKDDMSVNVCVLKKPNNQTSLSRKACFQAVAFKGASDTKG